MAGLQFIYLLAAQRPQSCGLGVMQGDPDTVVGFSAARDSEGAGSTDGAEAEARRQVGFPSIGTPKCCFEVGSLLSSSLIMLPLLLLLHLLLSLLLLPLLPAPCSFTSLSPPHG